MGQINVNDSIDENLSLFKPLSYALGYARLADPWISINSYEPIFQKTFDNLVHFISSAKQVLRPRHLQPKQRSVLDTHIFNKSGNKGPKNTAWMPFVLDLIRLFELLVVESILGHLVEIVYVPNDDEFVILALHLQIITGEYALFGHLKCVTNVSGLTKNDAIEHVRELDWSFVHNGIIFSNANDVFGSSLMKNASNFLGVAWRDKYKLNGCVASIQ